MWEYAAYEVAKRYSELVNWEEHYFVCPGCGQRIYEGRYHETEFFFPDNCTCCPICEFIFETNDWFEY